MSSSRPVNGEGTDVYRQTGDVRPGLNSSPQNTGAVENQSLLCGESMLSSSPPSELSAKSDVYGWKSIDSDNNNLPSVDKLVVNSSQLSDEDKRMNSGGHDRMTGPGTTTSKDSWLIQVSQQQARGHSLIRGDHHEPQHHGMLPLSAAPVGQSGVFRPPLTVGDHPHVLQYSGHPQQQGVFTTVGTLQRYSDTIYTPHSQSMGALHSPYYYPSNYPGGYQGRPILPHDYPSYSAVLASMGSHVQQSQLPRSPFPLPGPLPHQYQHHAGGASGRTGSQSSASSHPMLVDPHRQSLRSHSLSRDTKDIDSRTILQPQHRAMSPHAAKERKHLSSPVHTHELRHEQHRRSPDIREQRLSSSSSSLKQRILARPSDIHIESESAHRRPGERSPKRLRTSIGHPPPLQHTHQPMSSATSMVPPQAPHLPPPPPLQPTAATSYPSQPHFPPHFNKGSIIQLANGELKRVEDLRTEDFVHSADRSSDLKIDSSTVVRIEDQQDKGTAILGFSVGEHRVQVTVEATVEHPFYVFGRGWSSCQPQRTLQRFGLECGQLQVGDVCISLTHKHVQPPPTTVTEAAVTSSGLTVPTITSESKTGESAGNSRKRRWSAPDQLHTEDKNKQGSPPTKT